MLGKLLKYDLKNKYKALVIFYILSIVFALITRLFFLIDDNSLILNIIGKICSSITISMIANVIINNIMRSWARFRSNIYKDESYLTHTLPVTKNVMYLSKVLSVIISMFTSMLVVALTLFIAYYSDANITIVKQILLPFAEIYNSTVVELLAVILVVFFLELFVLLQTGFTGLIIGHRFNSSKVALSVLIGFVAYTINQVFILICLFVVGIFNKDVLDIFVTTEITNLDVIKNIMYISIIAYSLISAIMYFVNTKLLNKGVNVD